MHDREDSGGWSPKCYYHHLPDIAFLTIVLYHYILQGHIVSEHLDSQEESNGMGASPRLALPPHVAWHGREERGGGAPCSMFHNSNLRNSQLRWRSMMCTEKCENYLLVASYCHCVCHSWSAEDQCFTSWDLCNIGRLGMQLNQNVTTCRLQALSGCVKSFKPGCSMALLQARFQKMCLHNTGPEQHNREVSHNNRS